MDKIAEFRQRVEAEWAGEETSAAPYRGGPDDLLAFMMEIAAPLRNAAATLSSEDQAAAREEARQNLGALYDGTFTKVTAPVIIVTGMV